VRVSCLPTDVSAGAHEIMSFCQGHRNFVTAVALVGGLVVSGGGDGTLRLWNPLDGTLLHTLALGEGSDVEGKAEVRPRGGCDARRLDTRLAHHRGLAVDTSAASICREPGQG
jgi:hypothetical protein